MNSYKLILLEAGRWFGYQMMPGYGQGFSPYFSPILIRDVEPLKSGRQRLRLRFDNVFYAVGVQEFNVVVRVMKRTESYLLVDFENGDRCAVIGVLTFDWLRQYAPTVVTDRLFRSLTQDARADPQKYLNEIFHRTNHEA